MDERPAYSIGVVAQRTGVPADTIRAWERRYGVAVPKRTPGGHRLYSERDIQTLRWLKEKVAEGVPISNAVALHAGLAARATLRTVEPRPVGEISAALQEALLRFDAPRADALLSESYSLHGVVRTCIEVIQPALIAIGEGWHTGAVSVSQEHFASHYLTTKLSQLHALHAPASHGPIVITACAPGELHEIGVSMLALFLSWRGVRALNLGADVPVEALIEAVDDAHPRLVCLSAMTPATAKRARDAAERLLALTSPPLIGYGGGAFERDAALRDDFPGQYLGTNATEGANAAAALVAEPRTVAAD